MINSKDSKEYVREILCFLKYFYPFFEVSGIKSMIENRTIYFPKLNKKVIYSNMFYNLINVI